ncbi:MAG: threonine ammonia-lyase [Omnitrophica WOR_2 bacterium]
MIPQNWIEEASVRIAPHIIHTPLNYAPESDLFLKWENHQVTGSFKVRGAFNKVLSLADWERQKGLVAASAGNHGQGVALAGKQAGAPVIIYASEQASPLKVEQMRLLGADVRLVPGQYGDAERAGLAYARQSGAAWISPYNDPQVIAGQGTLALEICQDLPPLPECTWVVPVGGGGLISGIGAALETVIPRPRLVGVQSEASPFLHAQYHRGTQEGVVELPSLADGLAGEVEPGSLTFSLVKQYADDFVLVSEAEIAGAVAFAWQQYSEKIEGAAACALAAVIHGKVKTRPAVVLITGGNIQPELHEKIAGSSGG